jgi:hypothetical protein
VGVSDLGACVTKEKNFETLLCDNASAAEFITPSM